MRPDSDTPPPSPTHSNSITPGDRYTFEQYLVDFGKNYSCPVQRALRMDLFNANLAAAKAHNALNLSWKVGPLPPNTPTQLHPLCVFVCLYVYVYLCVCVSVFVRVCECVCARVRAWWLYDRRGQCAWWLRVLSCVCAVFARVQEGVNQFSDMTEAEFRVRLGYKKDLARGVAPGAYGNAPEFKSVANVQDLPTDVDWRQKGALTPVKDQGGAVPPPPLTRMQTPCITPAAAGSYILFLRAAPQLCTRCIIHLLPRLHA
jgi:hypothetical protein